MKSKIGKQPWAFTLIEVMIVISILGILFAILVPNLIRARFNAYVTGCIENEHALQAAMESYQVDQSCYPDTIPKLVSLGYISAMPICPSNPSSQYQTTYEVTTPDYKFYTISCPGLHYLQLQGTVRQGYPQVSAAGTMTTQ